VPGFCKAAKLEEVRRHNCVLTPGRYVGSSYTDGEGDQPFDVRFSALKERLAVQFDESDKLAATIRLGLEAIG
jgi:type I restriction enzyme M protein